ncbi:MAG: beta-lactamase family protein [Clostridia bacterium]|nr:beta-lactamase family protein [Clostridia bacterium]
MSKRLQCIDILKKGLNTGAYPSFAVAVGQGRKVYLSEVMGKKHTQPKPTSAHKSTLYDLASLTKLVGPTMIALKLLEEGKLLLTDPLSRYFTEEELKDAPQGRADVTLFQLLTHTSGITPHMPLWATYHVDGTAFTPEEAVSAILGSQPVCNPGEQVNYSCMGYILLGKVLERITEKPLDELAHTMVFKPLGMKHTMYRPHSKNVAATEFSDIRESYICGEVHDENAHFLGGVSANAGLFSTLGDMTIFATMLAERGKLSKGRYLQSRTFDLAVNNFTPGLAEARGLGFQLKPPMPQLSSMGDLMSEGSYGHTGFTGTSLFVDAETGRWAVLLTNAVHYGRDKTEFIRYRKLFHNALMTEDLD